MRNKLFTLLTVISLFTVSTSLMGAQFKQDLTQDYPTISYQPAGYEKVEDVAQYGGGDWSQVIGIARNISLKEAVEIADSNPEVTYFFHMKGWRMVLGPYEDGTYHSFGHGDTVFFSGEPWWGSANGLADGYIKINQE